MAGFSKEQREELRELFLGQSQSLSKDLDQKLATQRKSLAKQLSDDFQRLLEDYRFSALADVRTLLREELAGIYERLDRLEAMVTRVSEDLEPAIREIEAIKARVKLLEQQVAVLRTKTA